MYTPNFIEIGQTFCERTYGRTYWRTDISPSNVTRSTWRSRPKNCTDPWAVWTAAYFKNLSSSSTASCPISFCSVINFKLYFHSNQLKWHWFSHHSPNTNSYTQQASTVPQLKQYATQIARLTHCPSGCHIGMRWQRSRKMRTRITAFWSVLIFAFNT